MLRSILVWLIVGVLLGCAPAPSGPGNEADSRRSSAEVPKTITLGQLNAVKSYAPWDFSDTSGGGAVLIEIHGSSLVSQDMEGRREARLAADVPSFDGGSIALLPDGRMQVSWKLRPGVVWHDGAPFTSDDLLFSWDVLKSPEIPSSGSQTTVIRQIDSVSAPDAATFVITWKAPFFQAVDMGMRSFWPFPKHLLSEAFQGDKQAFMAQPYFTTEYVHLGPFRLVDFVPGERQIFQRFDTFFMGRPKVQTIIIQTIRDPNALFANVMAGAVDVVGERALSSELALQLRDEWRQSGDGTVLSRQYNWRYLQVQHGSQWSRPIELSQDVRVRRGLLQAIDRDALREFLYPGFESTRADTFILEHDPRGQVIGQPFARYTYDVAKATQELSDAGWVRASDGRMLSRDGSRVQIEIRGGNTDVQGIASTADSMRRLGIEVTEVILSGPTNEGPEYRSTFPGMESTARAPATRSSRISTGGYTPRPRTAGPAATACTTPIRHWIVLSTVCM